MFNWFCKCTDNETNKKLDALVRRLEIIERRVNNHGADLRQLLRDIIAMDCEKKRPYIKNKKIKQ
jgi:hypothetical protein